MQGILKHEIQRIATQNNAHSLKSVSETPLKGTRTLTLFNKMLNKDLHEHLSPLGDPCLTRVTCICGQSSFSAHIPKLWANGQSIPKTSDGKLKKLPRVGVEPCDCQDREGKGGSCNFRLSLPLHFSLPIVSTCLHTPGPRHYLRNPLHLREHKKPCTSWPWECYGLCP